MTFQESTKPLLRPPQAEERREEISRLRAILSAPPHIANRIEDRGQLRRNLQAVERDLKKQDPRPYESEDIDLAADRSEELKEEMLQGMPTQEEMRRNPSGAVDKHRRWEKRNKTKLTEWKNIQLRLHATDHGDLPDATDIANFERFRPSGGSQQLNMHNEQISGRMQFGPEPGAGPSVVFSERETALLDEIAPDIFRQLGTMTNEQRQAVKNFIGTQRASPSEANPRKRREMTPEQKERARENLAKARAVRAAKKLNTPE